MELAFSKPFIYDLNARFGFEGGQTKKIKNIYLKKKYLWRIPFIEILPRAYFMHFFPLKCSSRVDLGTRVLFMALIYHFPAMLSSRKNKDLKF